MDGHMRLQRWLGFAGAAVLGARRTLTRVV